MTDAPDIEARVLLTAAQLALIDSFQTKAALRSREDAIRLLLDIALESVTGRGRRFWDRPLVDPKD